ncbi:T9SS type B sorting domain-containing protein [Flavobacterium sp. J49]|uniref:T9SS type B sorting domain-containing protein n=1 Tax=Flavobacterium sp. J49 TaxID=2718534 RepID=UPI0015936530|nr:T9SS type B sorting domain-containing protein [Flavobacterium sp. J49]MBF6641116.1 T9SS type B sorting domain-containing protein [Flavobacterium sp. J49]NIC02363.1 T9SS type B sorting domain-containing protein [Flavobacterium sp. J49]
MKKLLTTISLLISAVGFSQPITVSSSQYTVPQLVNDVLINSPCVSATNITWRTGTDYGSSNGIGFFQNTNSGFPMQSGVILSTGNALNAPGPNSSILNDGSATWIGDASLEATLAASGISMVSTNATVLEFDFTPISPNFSFDFIFASEEYGNFQCQYSDAFAFLLTNLNTGTTTNLAVVPNSTNPISVVTIREFLYNSSCPSVNSQYFGSFNGGSNAANSATNFNGQTTVLTAASVLTPGVPYHIKLVIADRLDPQSDSAIFISSDSFNIGQDVLGLDLTTSSNTALCFGSNHTLDTGLNAAEYTFSWKRNGTTINGETGPTLIINQAGTYSVTYTSIDNSCQPITDSIIVEYLPQINSPNPNNLSKCDTGATTYTYNLDANTNRVKQGLNPSTVVTYHASQSDANNNINPLPLQYNGTSGQIIYVRIQLPNGCFRVKSFQLLVSPPPTATQPQNITMCATSLTQVNAQFNLTSQNAAILNGQPGSIYAVRYYTSLNDATNSVNPISGAGSFVSSGQTIYVRVYNVSDPSCFSLTSFNLIVNPIPVVDELENVLVCSNYTLQPLTNGNYFTEINGGGTPLFAGDVITETQTIFIYNQSNGPGSCTANSSFTVTIVDTSDLTPEDVNSCGSYTLPSLNYGKYYTGPSASGTEIPAGTVINSSQTIYYYFITEIAPVCIVDSSFTITILPTIEVGDRADVFECTSYTLPALSIGNYYTGTGASGNQLAPGTVITLSQTIYVYATTTGTSPCSDEDSFEVYIGLPQPQNIAQCNGYTLPQLPIGNYYTGPMGTGQQIPAGTVINTSSTVYIYAPTASGGVNCTDNLNFTISISQPQIDTLSDVTVCESYTLPSLTNGEYYTETDGTGTMLYPGDVILATQTIYIFKRLNSSCFNQSSFTVTILPLPAISSRSDIDICDQYVLTNLQVGNYFTGPDGTGTMLAGGTVITSSQRIYIYAVSGTTPPCVVQNSFQINIFSTSADVMADVTTCDSFTLPTLTATNKYYTQSGGPNGSGVEILPGTVITTSQTIYIFKESLIRTSFSCVDETSFTVTINNTPVIPTIVDVYACNSYTLQPLTLGNYYTGSGGTGTLLQVGDTVTHSQTVYVFAHTNTTPDCSSEISFNITIFNVDVLPNVTTCENYTLPNLTVGQYFTGSNGTGLQLNAGATITTSQTVYIYGLSPYLPRCSDESSFTVTIIDTPIANSVPTALRSVCDMDGNNDGITSFNLTTLSATILGTQTSAEFTIAYYATMSDALNQSNAITSTTLATVYVRVSNTLTSSCFDIKPISIVVNTLPEPTPVDGIICFDSETQTLLNAYTIHSGLSSATHSFIWTNEAGTTVGTASNYTAVLPGIYTLIATKTATGCSSEPVNVTVNPSEPAVVTYTVEEDFSDSQSIIVTATGQGNNFEYQLDNGPFQDSPVFNNVSSGMHLITVRDRNGCGSTTIQAVVINYPKYFTPNGDGYNDTWNITNLSNQPSANIIIYDRYGKIIKQIRPNGNGWDGTYNGNMMPSDDYWFSVSYTDENQVSQEFRAHFAMKR